MARYRYVWVFAGCVLALLAWAGCKERGTTSAPETAAAPSYPFQDASLPVTQRVDDLVSRMTLEEKVGQMQMDAPAIERLGVPAYHWWNEALHGVARNGVATVFPQAIGLAATWNTDLHYEMATAISIEARAKHNQALKEGRVGVYTGLDFWSPNINIVRDPRWGRGQETYGEDPYLTGRFGVAFVRGMQGDDPTYMRVVATPKHFAVHSGPEPERHRFDARVSPRDLWGTYLPAFEACVREGKAYSVMGAYNRMGGLPCCANPLLLTEILRKQWGFAGYVVSDVDAVHDIYDGHRTADSPELAAALAVKAGCDLNGGGTYGSLTSAVQQGMITEAEIDVSVKRLMEARFRLGMFDPPEKVPYAQIPYDANDSQAHDALARKSARQSLVLLKNAGDMLPLRKDLKTIAVIGPSADAVGVLEGNYNGVPARPVTILEGIRSAVPLGTRVLYSVGGPPVGELLPLEEVVPASCLFVDERRETAGLNADYYRNGTFADRPWKTRVDARVDFDWGTQGVRDGMKLAEEFTARWTGVLVPPESGKYQLGISGPDGFRLWLEGKLLVEDWRHASRRSAGVSVELEKNKAYALRVEYYHGTENAAIQLRWTRPGGEPFYGDAVRTAQRADAVVMVLGLTPDLEREEDVTNFEGFHMGDRTTLDLPRVQEELLEAVCATGKPVVLVLTGGSALSVNWAAVHVPAILQAWYPGQQGGNAVADVLFGDYNPAGRLPVTFYKSVADLPPFDDYRMAGRTYRYFAGEPLWPFGYGLSYTRFEYRGLDVPEMATTAQDVTVRVRVRNAGARDGDEVVQLYVSRAGLPAPAPVRALQGFKRVSLKAGEEKAVEFTLTPHQLAVVGDDGKRLTLPGEIKVQVGPSSAGGLTGTLRLEGAAAEPEFRYMEPKVR